MKPNIIAKKAQEDKMTVPQSLQSIEKTVEKLHTQATPIDTQSAVQFALDLKGNIINKTEDPTRCTLVLANILESSRPSDEYLEVFDEKLLDALFQQITSDSTLEVINSAVKVLSSVVCGSIFVDATPVQFSIPVLNSTNTNLKVLETFSSKLYLENLDLMVNELSFINGYLELDHLQLDSITHLTEFILHLQKSEIFTILGNLGHDLRFKKALEQPIVRTRAAFHKFIKGLNTLKIDLSSKYQQEVLNIILDQITIAETEAKKNLILDKFSLFHLIDLYLFLENTNITFKKHYHQQVLFNSNKGQKFPLPLASLSVSNYLVQIFDPQSKSFTKIQKCFLWRDALQYHLINKFLEIWVESKAEIEDFDNIFKLLELVLQRIEDALDVDEEFNPMDKIALVCRETSYQQLRQIQLEIFKIHVHDATSTETKGFNKLLNEQTFEFVKNQRFLSLQQGTWVYPHLPSSREAASSNKNHFFIILSTNFKQLLYKEFKTKPSTKPDIDKSGTSVDIASITNFEIEEILQADKTAPPASNTRLINLMEKTIINKISLINRKNKVIFSFYAKKDESLVWLDGLNLLIGNYDNLSKELKAQLSKLYNIRSTVQLLNHDENLEKELSENGNAKSDNADSLEFFETLSKNFYYT